MNKLPEHAQSEVAVIGLACQFPGAEDEAQFWHNLAEGKETVSFFSDKELQAQGIDPSLLKDPHYVKAKGVIDDVYCFDAELFGYLPKEAENMDPQQRRLLECAWTALEKAGYAPDQYDGLIGVFVGGNPSSYFLSHIYPNLGKDPSDHHEDLSVLLANGPDYLATRISYKLNLKGPSKTIQTACSTSLVTIHDACQSLMTYQCDIALAGGVALSFPQKAGYFYTPDSIHSPDGHCRAFDSKAAGTVFGDGLGLVVLKRLEDALADNDTIIAVIKGSAVNNDGSNKVGYLAPSVQGQAEVIAGALAAADVTSESITYVETHGTATSLGDPIEISALTQAYQTHTQKRQYCAIGSVKTNVGHLTTAAGIAGFIKTLLMIKHKKIPASLHFKEPNAQIDFEQTPFFVNTRLTDWKCYTPLRAGVSSFGIGGTNAHVILEEFPLETPSFPSNKYCVFPFSAKNDEAMARLIKKFVIYLKDDPIRLSDIAYTLQVGRTVLPYRLVFVSSCVEDLINQLESFRTEKKANKVDTLFKTQDFEFLLAELTKLPVESEARKSVLEGIGGLWQRGERIPWLRLYEVGEVNRRVPLPTYVFSKDKFCKEISYEHSRSLLHSLHDSNFSLYQTLISTLWRELLRLNKIEMDANFFELGGDSLSAIEMLSQFRLIFNIEIPLRHFLANPSLNQLVKTLEIAMEERKLTVGISGNKL